MRGIAIEEESTFKNVRLTLFILDTHVYYVLRKCNENTHVVYFLFYFSVEKQKLV